MRIILRPSILIVVSLLVSSCMKEKVKEKVVQKQIKHTTRDFTKGIMTIEFEDGTRSVSRIPVDSSAFKSKGIDSAKARLAGTEYKEYASDETELETVPMWDPINQGWFYGDAGPGVGPKPYTKCHVILTKVDGLITAYGDYWVEITRNASVYFNWQGRSVYRTATIMGLTFEPGTVNVPVSICVWDYYINYYFAFSGGGSPPSTRQEHYTDIKYVQ